MKKGCLLIALSLSVLSYSQDDILYMIDWRLDMLYLDGQINHPPINEELSSVNLFFENAAETLSTNVCSNLNGLLLFDNSNYTFTFPEGLNISTINCDNSDNTTFEEIYFNFFLDNATETFNYSITIIDFKEGYGLDITAPNGDAAYYYDYYLATQENLASNLRIYPNPVEDKLFISFSNDISTFSINIYDITGKSIHSENPIAKGESIYVGNLKSGIYFISIKDELGNVSIKKIIKN